MTYVIHGATGAQGQPVTTALLAAGESVTALSRRADARVDGARVLAGDFSTLADLTRAYDGAAGVFVHLPMTALEEQLTYARNVVAAVQAAKPARVVFSTSGEPGSAARLVMDSLADSDVSTAVIQPTYYLENLLAPFIVAGVRERGVLTYPLRSDMPVSWTSHLDIADVAVALFRRPEISGTVMVGQFPGLEGHQLATAFGERIGRKVSYEQITPESFGESMGALIGADAAAGVTEVYRATLAAPDRQISPHLSAETILGITPRSTRQWLDDIEF